MKTTKEVIAKTIEMMGDKIAEKDKKKHEDLLVKVLEEGQCIKDVIGFDAQTLEALYGQAYNLYKSGNYERSALLFRLLVALNPVEYKYAMGLGASYHLLKNYHKAIEGYMLGAYLDPLDPVPFFHVADCYIQLHEARCAVFALKDTIDRCSSNAAYAKIREKAQLMLEAIHQQIKEIDKSPLPAKKAA